MWIPEDIVEFRLSRSSRQALSPRGLRLDQVLGWVVVALVLAAAVTFTLVNYGLSAALAVVYLAPAALFVAAILICPVARQGPETRR